jgi:hypothetical protein
MNPRPGDFGLTRITGYVGTLIRIGQWLNGDGWRDYQHAFIVVGDTRVIEAQPGGARYNSLSAYPDAAYSSWPLTAEQRARIVWTAVDMKGTPYSALDYFALALRRFHIPAPWLRRYIESSKHDICSQLVDACYQAAGVQLFTDGRWNGYVTPLALDQVLEGPK